MNKANTVVVNFDNQKWGRGKNLAIAMKNASATLDSKAIVYFFKNDDWDITNLGHVTWNKGDLILKQEINFE